jgi:hypothetical protein
LLKNEYVYNIKFISKEIQIERALACLIVDAIVAESSSTTSINAQIKARVVVNAPDNALSWEISPSAPGIYTKTQILHIKANTDWQLGVKDGDSDAGGSMREWSGSGYGEQKLSLPMRVSADREVVPLDGSELPIAEGKMTGGKGINVQVTFEQVVTPDDLLKGGKTCRKEVTFVGLPKMG